MERRQFTLRARAVVIGVLGLVFAWVRSRGSMLHALVAASHSLVAWGLCLGLGTAVSRVYGPSLRGRTGSGAAWVAVALSASALLYLILAHHRTMTFDLDPDRPFPHPDRIIFVVERWFDVRRPVSPGNIKMHGEFTLVGFFEGLLVLGFAASTGLLLGILLERRM